MLPSPHTEGVTLNCGHKCVCEDCARRYDSSAPRGVRMHECPLCREKVSRVVRIFE